jgi:hypothetical protein
MLKLFRRKPARAGRIDISPPAPAPDRKGLAVVAIARNEEPHIRDWLAFHALAGVRTVILYDNQSTDRTADIACNFPGMTVMVIPWQIEARTTDPALILPRQVLAYVHAVCTFGHDFALMAFIDIDEFLVPVEAATLEEALSSILPICNLSLPWAMFGHGGHDTVPEDATPFAYRQRARVTRGALLRWKCIVDPCEVTQVSTHKFHTRPHGDITVNTLGQKATNKRRDERFVTFDLLTLNHYYLRSRTEMERKIKGGAVSGVPESERRLAIEEKARLIEADSVMDDRAVRFLARHGVADTASLRSRFAVAP